MSVPLRVVAELMRLHGWTVMPPEPEDEEPSPPGGEKAGE